MSLTNVSRASNRARQIALIALGGFVAAATDAATLTDRTVEAWNRYVETAETSLAQSIHDESHFFLLAQRASSNETVDPPPALLVYSPYASGSPVPSGLVHHWIGTVFIPNVSLAQFLAVAQDYNEYSAVYTPGVVESKLLSRDGDKFAYRLKFIQKGFGVKAGMIADFQTEYHPLGPDLGYSVTRSTALTELAKPGTDAERPLSVKESHGSAKAT